MDVRRDQLPLPLPLDDAQVSLLLVLLDEDQLLCSEGTDRWDAMAVLRDRGLVVGHYCPNCCDIWQWKLTPAGRALVS